MTDYDKIAELISRAIIESNKPLLKKIEGLTEQLQSLTNRLEKPLEVNATEVVEKKYESKHKVSPTSYVDDIPIFGKRNNI